MDLRESKVGLDDDVESSRANEAIGTGKRKAQLVHDFCYADRGGSGNTDSAMHESRSTLALSSLCCRSATKPTASLH